MPFTEQTLEEKPYNKCIKCDKIGVRCDGPNFLAMSQERFGEWCKLRKQHLGWTRTYLAEITGVSEVSISRILSGKSQGLHVETMRAITKALVNGSWGQYPCADGSSETNELEKECLRLREQVAEDQRKIDHLKEQVVFRGNLLEQRGRFLRRKDHAIVGLSVAAAVLLVLAVFLLVYFAIPDMLDGSWGHIRY